MNIFVMATTDKRHQRRCPNCGAKDAPDVHKLGHYERGKWRLTRTVCQHCIHDEWKHMGTVSIHYVVRSGCCASQWIMAWLRATNEEGRKLAMSQLLVKEYK